MKMAEVIGCITKEMEKKMVWGKFPALTLSGGKLSDFLPALCYRVWVHHKDGGDDKYFEYSILEKAMQAKKRLEKNKKYCIVENPLALVWDKARKDFREVQIDGHWELTNG